METTDQEKPIPQKPIQVTYAFYLILGAAVINLVGSMVTRVLEEQASLSELLTGTIFVAFILLIPLWLAFKINAGRNWARWGFVVFAVLGLFDTLNLLYSFSDHPIQSAYYVLSVGLSFLAVFLLFQRPVNIWFKVVKIYESMPDESRHAVEATDKPSGEVDFSPLITQEETPIAKKVEGTKTVAESEVDLGGDLQISVDLLAHLLLKPQNLVAYAMSAFSGIAVTAVINYQILGSDAYDYGLPVMVLCIGPGAFICVLFSFISMVIALSRYKTSDRNLKSVGKQARQGVLIGIIPGCLATAIFTIIALGIIAV